MTLDNVLPELLKSYQQWKSFEQAKNEHKEEFFNLADEKIEQRGVAMTVAAITALSEESAVERAERFFPTWTIDEHRPHPWMYGVYEIVLKENPSLQPYSIEQNGYKFSRTISKGAVMLDEEWLQEEKPELYEEVTFELPWGVRIPRPLEALEQETLALIKKYIYPDKPRVSLGAPREVKGE